MRVLQRVEEIRRSEHVRLRMAIERATRAIDDLKEAQAQVLSGPSEVDMFGDPLARRRAEAEAAEKGSPPLVNLSGLLAAWRPFESMLIDRVDTWEMDLWPLVRRWAIGEPVEGAVRAVASNMLARRAKLEPALREMRIQTGFVGALRPPLVAVFAAVEACDAVEADVVPALVAGRSDVSEPTVLPAAITLSSDEVARNLRSRPRPRPPVAARRPAKPSLWGRVMKALKPD